MGLKLAIVVFRFQLSCISVFRAYYNLRVVGMRFGGTMSTSTYGYGLFNEKEYLVFVTGRGWVGFHFVTLRYSGPGSTLCGSSPPRMTPGPGRAVGRGGYFTFLPDCLEGPPLLVPHSCRCAGPHLFLRVIFSD